MAKTRILHMQATIPFVIERIRDQQRKGEPQDYVTRGKEPVSYEDAIAELERMKASGLKLVPCCTNVDAEGKCLGAEIDA